MKIKPSVILLLLLTFLDSLYGVNIDSKGEGDYNSIEAALKAGEKDIYIKNGTYKISKTLEINVDNTNLFGESTNGVIIEPLNFTFNKVKKNDCHDILYVNANYVTISNLTLKQNKNCRQATFVTGGNHHITLKNSHIIGSNNMFSIFFAGPPHNNGAEALEMLKRGELDYNNQVINNVIESIFLGDILSFSLQKEGNISNNILVGGQISLFLNRKISCTNNIVKKSKSSGIVVSLPSTNIDIKRNTIIEPKSSGIRVSRQFDYIDDNRRTLTSVTHRSNMIMIEENNITDSRYNAITVRNLEDSLISNNYIKNSDFSGIELSYSGNISIISNTIIDATLVASKKRKALSEWNTKWDSGIYLDVKVVNSEIKDNMIYSTDSNFKMNFGIAVNQHNGNRKIYIKGNKFFGEFKNKRIFFKKGDVFTNKEFTLEIVILISSIILSILIFYFRRYRNALLLQLQRNPKDLLTLSPALLPEAKEKLAKINELESILKSVGIEEQQLDEAISFDESENKAELFSKRIPTSYLLEEGRQQKLACQKTELSVDDFLICFTDENANEIEERFKEDGNRVFVVSSQEHREAMAKLARDKTNNIIAPTQEQWSEFLLSAKSQDLVMRILAECLEFSSISPYQTSKGVNKEVDFFGRIKIVRDIKMNSNRNYMIVGGRQLGKSSILKKLERSYFESTSVDCYFINLEGKKGDIILAMAQNFGLESSATLEDVYKYIYNNDKKMLILVDEVDEFVEPEIERDYETLKTLKNLAEEGKATFVFVGYWTLYQYVVADYLSPLYNFGELIVLEGLEKEACTELMTKPMKRIGLTYEDEKFLEEVIEACGQRANLLATVCDEVLKEHEGKIITKQELKKAMKSTGVRDKLLGWESMERLDLVIIYFSIEKDAFEFDEVLDLLEKEGLNIEASVIKKSLERLVIAYILKRDDGEFSYRVPLMRESVLKTNEKGRRALFTELVGKF